MLRKLLERAIAAVPEAYIAAYSGDSVYISLGDEHFSIKEGQRKVVPSAWPDEVIYFERDILDEVKFMQDCLDNVEYLI